MEDTQNMFLAHKMLSMGIEVDILDTDEKKADMLARYRSHCAVESTTPFVSTSVDRAVVRGGKCLFVGSVDEVVKFVSEIP